MPQDNRPWWDIVEERMRQNQKKPKFDWLKWSLIVVEILIVVSCVVAIVSLIQF